MNMQDKEQRAQLKKICPAALNYIERLEAERDEIAQQLDYCFKVELADARARSEALESAVKTKLTACSTCAKKPPEGYCDELYDCINSEWNYPFWQFDELRFSEKPTPCKKEDEAERGL